MANEKSTRPQKGPGGGGPSSRFAQQKPEIKDAKKTILRLVSYMGDRWVSIALTIVLVLATTLLNVGAPVLMGMAIDNYILLGDIQGLGRFLLYLMAAYVGISVFSFMQQRLMIGVSQYAVKKLRTDLFAKLQTFSLSFFDSHSHGDLMSRMTNDIDNVSNTLSQSVTQLIGNILTLFGIIIMMFVISWQMAIISLLSVPLTLVLMKLIGRRTRKNFSQQQSNLGDVNGMIEEYFTAHQVVSAYGKEEETIQRFKAKNDILVKNSIRAQIFSGMMMPLMSFLNNISYAVIISAGAVFHVMGLVTLGVITVFMTYAKQFGRPLNQIAQLYNTVQLAIAGAERVFEIMDEKPEIVNIESAEEVTEIHGDVCFDEVDFSYDGKTPVLKKVSLCASSGETIALVGPTGAGKTTVINLLTRFYDIQGGEITIDGKPLTSLDKESLRRRLGIVLQDTYLFSGSVKENIRYGRLDATDEEVMDAAKLANAHGFIHRLPDGYDTVLSESASNLSQGQRQLLAIARAILADPDILVLDEATSSVDTRTEANIQEALLRLMDGRTSFVIAHRLSTIRDADQILVMDQGEIVEGGTHESLLELDGFYARMYYSQFKSKVS